MGGIGSGDVFRGPGLLMAARVIMWEMMRNAARIDHGNVRPVVGAR